ncbi:hypothetical protein P5V15_002567 [Pogonomyrmex californicus]
MGSEVIRRSIKLASMLDIRINAEKFLTQISNVSLDANYLIFTRFSCECSDTILGVLYQLGYFGTDARLLRIAGEIIETRRAVGHEEEDVGGHIQNLLSHLHNVRNARQKITAVVNPLTQIRRRRAEDEIEAGPARRARIEPTQKLEEEAQKLFSSHLVVLPISECFHPNTTICTPP